MKELFYVILFIILVLVACRFNKTVQIEKPGNKEGFCVEKFCNNYSEESEAHPIVSPNLPSVMSVTNIDYNGNIYKPEENELRNGKYCFFKTELKYDGIFEKNKKFKDNKEEVTWKLKPNETYYDVYCTDKDILNL